MCYARGPNVEITSGVYLAFTGVSHTPLKLIFSLFGEFSVSPFDLRKLNNPILYFFIKIPNETLAVLILYICQD